MYHAAILSPSFLWGLVKMTSIRMKRQPRVGTALAALAIGLGTLAVASPAEARGPVRHIMQASSGRMPVGTFKPSGRVQLSIGQGQLITLPSNVSDVWTSNPDIADVYVSNPRQIHLFGKKFGDSTVIATAANGAVVYATNVMVAQNINSVDEMLKAAMPDADIHVQTVGQMAVINGTVASPADSAQAQQLVAALLNPGIDTSKDGAMLNIVPVNRLRTATPLQVTLKVRIAEVNRSLVKSIGVNLLSRDTSGGSILGHLGQGNPGTIVPITGTPFPNGAPNEVGQTVTFNNAIGATSLGLFGKLFGVGILGTLDLAENDGLVTTLAEPTLTALSGETASFLAGGEFPIPISQSLGSVTVEYKQYGVGLAFTPIVLADGRISMRVRPEVSELSSEGAIKLNGFDVPALTTRRAETTVELGSGQSFMIAGLLRNAGTNNINKAPFLGDLPILGALFRSTSYKKSQTELVIIVTPYLVRPVSTQLASPTDGLRAPTDVQRFLEGKNVDHARGSATTTTVAPRPGMSAPAAGAAAVAAPAPGFKL